MAEHVDIISAECHEPKYMTNATTADHGKVLTPSSTINNVSELVQLEIADLSDGASVVTPSTVNTLTNKRIQKRVKVSTYAANLDVNADNFDVLACNSLTGNVIINAPTGTATDAQTLQVRLTQDGVGSRTVTWNAAFSTITAISATLDKTSTWTFNWNAAVSKWQEVSAQVGT